MDYRAGFIAMGFFYELLFQYPSFLPHPIAYFGKLINLFERLLLLKDHKSPLNLFTGAIMTVFLVVLTYFSFYYLESLITHRWGLFIYRTFFTVSIVASGSLFFECLKVGKLLELGKVDLAKKQLSMLVTRDTASMNEEKVIETTLETLSENLCDGVIAPLFYLFLGGVPLAMAFKMASTLDSMVGYKNERYNYFGRCSAYLDDILNFIPARLTAIVIILSAYLMNFDGKNSFKSWLRDRNKSESPNSGHPEAALAGALGISFGGRVSYFGRVYEKPYIGIKKRDVKLEDIKAGIKLSYVASLIFLVLAFGSEYLVRRLFIYV